MGLSATERTMLEPLLLTALAAAGLAAALPKARQRLELSLAKHPSLTGHSRMARRVAAFVPGYSYDEAGFFGSDGAPTEVQARRRAGLIRLAGQLAGRHPESINLTQRARESIPDLQFTGAYRVPFQYAAYLRQHLSVGAFVQRSDGVTLTDLDGRTFLDVTGSYGVNVFGNDFYKACIAEGSARVADLGPVLGSYHPAVAWNVEQLKRI
jgi:glutamate-1-semialdehyde 2,1-aminomutase